MDKKILSEYGFNDFINDILKIYFFDSPKPTNDISFDVTCNNLALYKTGLRKCMTNDHFVC